MNLSGLFGSAYRALDPVLPFDGLLDPRFASIPRGPSQASTVVPLNPQGTSPDPGVQAPQAQPARSVPQPKPHVSPWRVIDGVLGKGQTFSEAIDYERARPQMEDARRRMMAFAAALPQEEQFIFAQSPQKWLEYHQQQGNNAAFQAAFDPQTGRFDTAKFFGAGGRVGGAEDMRALDTMSRPDYAYIEGPDGIHRIDKRTGEDSVTSKYERQAPAGYMWAGDKLAPIPGGPADIGTIKTQAATRRGVTVSMPTPSRARVAGAPKKTAGAAPWAMNWSN
jgi:hypothetical protein